MTDEIDWMPERDAANRWHAYMHGWRDGAATRAMRIERHPDAGIIEEYNRGYTDGYVARQDAAKAASARIGHEPAILRTQAER
jgi:hypothetical protein